MSFHEVVKSSIFGTIPDSNVTSTLVLGGFIFTVCQFLITFVQPAPYGRYTNSSPSYLTCVFFIFMPISVSFIIFFVFVFWSLLATKLLNLRKYYVIFVYILQGKMGKTGKKTERKSCN